jgi:hypothetical protein
MFWGICNQYDRVPKHLLTKREHAFPSRLLFDRVVDDELIGECRRQIVCQGFLG